MPSLAPHKTSFPYTVSTTQLPQASTSFHYRVRQLIGYTVGQLIGYTVGIK